MKRRLLAFGMAILMAVSIVLPSAVSTAKAEDGFDGYIYFTVERVTLGQGFIVEPVKAGFYEEDTLADITERVLGDMSTYEGDISSYYLESIVDGGEPAGWTVSDIPEKIISAIGGEDKLVKRAKSAELAAFDYTNMSGWMYSLNNMGLSAGAGSYKYSSGEYSYSAGDVVRLQYTLYGYGMDLNTFDPSWGYGEPLIELANKDNLIKAAADYEGDKSADVYVNAINVLADWDATADEISSALAAFNASANHAPVLADGKTSTQNETVKLGYTYTVDLTSVFVDEDGDELTYTVAVDGAEETVADKEYSFVPSEAGVYNLVFKANDGKETSASYTVILKVTDTEGTVNVTINMNAISTTMTLVNSEGETVDVGTPEGKAYELNLEPGYYILTGINPDGATSNGTIGFTVTEEENQSFSFYTVTVYCSGAGASWVYGEDYSLENFKVQSKNGEVRTDVSVGTLASNTARKTFLVYNGDTYGFWFTPSEELRETYAVTYQAGTVTANAAKSISPSVKYNLDVVIPYEDLNNDGVNDYILEVGTLNTYYIYSYNENTASRIIPASAEENTYGYDVEAYSYDGAKNVSYFYRVSNPYNNDAVTYGDYVSLSGDTVVDVTKNEMYIGGGYDKDTVIDDLSVNAYDVADIFLNVNAAGYLNLDKGDTYTLYPLRNWLAIEGIGNSKVIEPDFHYTVLDENGNASDSVIKVTENQTNTTSKHSAEITAVGEGTAIVLVTYDAMTNAQGYASTLSKDRTFFSAIWPENTGVFVVTVGKEDGIETGMTINEGANTVTTKLSGDYIDSEHDVLYYTGDEGASYTFTPESGAVVTVASPVVGKKVSYNGFSDAGVKYNSDKSVTIEGLTEGSNIVCLEKDGKTEYQIIRAKQVSYEISFTDSEGNEIDASEAKAGDNVSIVFDTIYHPANKLSGYYNNGAKLVYKGGDGSTVSGTGNQYVFAATLSAQTVSFTIPKYWSGENYNLTSGTLVTGGFGSAFGAHRSVTYEGGKPADFTAVTNVSSLGVLPDISITLAKTEFIEGKLVLKNSETNEIITDYEIEITDTEGNAVYADDEGNISVLAGTFSYKIYAQGYMYKTGSFSVDEDTTSFTRTIKLDASSDDAWDGISKSEPELIDGFYQISNGAELAWFAAHINSASFSNKTNLDSAVLTADIDMAGYPSTMIGTLSAYAFGGIFDGNGKTISNVNIEASSGTVYGLFKYAAGSATAAAVIKDVTVEGEINLTGSAATAGGIAGYANKYVEISGCTSNIDINVSTSASNAIVGGIVGYTYGNKDVTTKITDCVNNGSISVNASGTNEPKYVGGIIGEALYGTEVTNCINNGSISGNTSYVGGIAGYQNATVSGASIISNCANKADIEGKTYAAGITGYAYVNGSAALNLKAENCYNTGNITASEYAGGLMGYVKGYSAAKPVEISNCYNAGNVTAEISGAVIGYLYNDYILTDSVYYLDSSSGTTGDIGEAKSSDELKVTSREDGDILTLLGEAFDGDILSVNKGYPVLYFENYITVNVSAYDYTAAAAGLEGASETGEIMDIDITVVYGTNGTEAAEQAFAEAGISQSGAETGYISEINGLESGTGGGYSGWCFSYNNDDYSNFGMSYVTLSDGDTLRFDYTVNPDYGTDDIGNGWYGLPIVAEFTLNGETVTMSKTSVYDESWNLITDYYINGEKTSALGTQESPFEFEIELPYGTDITSLNAEYATSLNEHYRIVDGLESDMDYTDGVVFSLSSLGGLYKSYYKVTVSIAPANPLSDQYDVIRGNVLDYVHATVKEPVISSIGGEWAVIDLARGNVKDEDWYTSYYDYVSESIKGNGSAVLSGSKSTENSRVIIGLTSIGAEPENVAGYNLLEPLSDFDYVVRQGINGAIYALIALDTNGYEIPEAADGVNQTTREGLIQYILGRELENGGWALTGDTADADITAMALQALAPYYDTDSEVKAAADRALEVLSAMQMEDGGYTSWGAENSESCAQVVCALSALGINADTDERFVKNGNSVLDALLSYYDSTTGGFLHEADGDVNQMATEQAAYALDAYYRLLNDRNTLYDMSDSGILYKVRIEESEESTEEPEESTRETVESSETAAESTTDSGNISTESVQGTTAGNTQTSNVNTGDSTNAVLYVIIMIFAGLALTVFVSETKKRNI